MCSKILLIDQMELPFFLEHLQSFHDEWAIIYHYDKIYDLNETESRIRTVGKFFLDDNHYTIQDGVSRLTPKMVFTPKVKFSILNIENISIFEMLTIS